ncbi:MAG: hypothetical protein EXR65_03420 [Dehalococcoidia bacterium]|nr:hypothetical protein [Dehalococcoidia bacterium]
MSGPHADSARAPRPTDLVALVTFDGEVHENQAVTRERLGRPTAAPHPLNAAIEQWLGGRQYTWIDVRGRQIDGIATARELGSRRAWIIDTLVDATAASEPAVAAALLWQALAAAARHRVTHLLLRTAVDAPARADALRAGFQSALEERLWEGPALRACDGPGYAAVAVRDACPEDAFALFQLYNRALPMQGRQALAVTLEEWLAVQERRWLRRGSRQLVAVEGDRIAAALRVVPARGRGQFDLIADADGMAGAAALLDLAVAALAGAERVLALVSRCAAPLDLLLSERGLEPGAAYELLSRRSAIPVAERGRVAAGVAVSTDA